MNRKDIFDRLWVFSKRYMYHAEGPYAGYFAWSVQPDGRRNSEGPAPDGEEYYAMALFFASARWGEGKPPFDYAEQARDILRHAVHQPELTRGGHAMWDLKTALIKFVPELPFPIHPTICHTSTSALPSWLIRRIAPFGTMPPNPAGRI